MLSLLQRYIYRQLLAVFGLTLGGFTLLMLVFVLMKPIQAGLPPKYVARMIPLAVPYAIGWTLPISMVAACIVTYGRMESDNEMTALRASGIHLFPVILPAVVLGLLFSVAGVYINDDLSPATSSSRALLKEIAEELPIAYAFLEDPIYEFEEGGKRAEDEDPKEGARQKRMVKVLAWDVRGEMLYDVVIHQTFENGQVSIIRAKTARVTRVPESDAVELQVSEGHIATIDPRTRQTNWVQYGSARKEFDLPTKKHSVKVKHLTTADLLRRLRAGGQDEKWDQEARVTVHGRRALALSCMAFVLIGVPLGMVARRGNKLFGFGLAVVVMFVLYYPLMVAGKTLCREGLPAWIGMWVPDLVVSIIGVVLLIRLLRR